jgi:hypothetical protein
VARLRAQLSERRTACRSGVPIFGTIRAIGRRRDPDPNVDPVAWQTYWTTTRNSLQVMSEQSGGFVAERIQDLVRR